MEKGIIRGPKLGTLGQILKKRLYKNLLSISLACVYFNFLHNTIKYYLTKFLRNILDTLNNY